jgi:threonine dehydratase
MLGKAATIVMPADAPAIKVENTRGYGAEVRLYDRARESREAIGAEIAARTGAALIRPYDDPRIIAGQGTLGLELAEQARDRDAAPDLALAPCGGGGLIAGSALALSEAFPNIAIYAVEPAGLDDTRRSLAAGARRTNAPEATSICDALLVPTPGELTFRINQQLLAGGIAVSDDEVRNAMAFAFRHLKLVVEPGGAVALAAVLSGKVPLEQRTAAVVLSGGNVDPALFAAAIKDCSA